MSWLHKEGDYEVARRTEGQVAGDSVGHLGPPAVELLKVMLEVPDAAGSDALLIHEIFPGSTRVISVSQS